MGLTYRVLGPLELEGPSGRVPLGGAKQRSLLALLLLHAGQVVSRETLISGLWGEDPPDTVANGLQVCASGLRRALRPVTPDGDELVVSHGRGGYRLQLADDDRVDLLEFEQAAVQGLEQLRRGEAALAREALGAALDLWRGPALADLGEVPFAEVETQRLESRRAAVLHARLEADLALGRHSEVLGELRSLVARHSLEEQWCGLLVRALYAAGRQAEALEAYATTRRVLDEELGVEPGPELRALHEDVLRQDPSLTAAASRPGPAAPPPSNLPAETNRFVGRADDLRAALELLGQRGVRLLCVTGPGGTGKTRLALEAARTCLSEERYPDGVWLVPLADVRDPELVAPSIMTVLGLVSADGSPPQDVLAQHLSSRRTLLVLDNLEHLLPAAGVLVALLDACPGLTLLCTSRTALRVRAERELPLPPLSLPAVGESAVDQAALSDAVALFVERAQASRPAFALGSDNVRDVVEVVRLLDGLPLAVELAAARVKLFAPAALRARLVDRLGFLNRGSSDLPERQQTLRATLDWSYDLLDGPEQDLLRSLAVFAGGWDVDALEAVGSRADGPDALDLLQGLVDKSLVQAEDVDGETRFGLLQLVREYALGELAAAEGADEVRDRHLQHYAGLVASAAPPPESDLDAPRLRRLELELDNLRAALDRAVDAERPDVACDVLVGLRQLWYYGAHPDEGRRRARALREDPALLDVDRGRLLLLEGELAIQQCDLRGAAALLESALPLLAVGEHPAEHAWCLYQHVRTAMDVEGLDRAGELAGRALAQLEGRSGTSLVRALLVNIQANVAEERQDLAEAARLYDDYLRLAREAGSVIDVSLGLCNLAGVLFARGEQEPALALLEEGLRLSPQHSSTTIHAMTLMTAAAIALEQGDGEHARQLLRQTLVQQKDSGHSLYLELALEGAAGAVAVLGQAEAAAVLYGAADARREATGVVPVVGVVREAFARPRAAARARLGARPWELAQDRGRLLAPAQALDLALQGHPTEADEPPRLALVR